MFAVGFPYLDLDQNTLLLVVCLPIECSGFNYCCLEVNGGGFATVKCI